MTLEAKLVRKENIVQTSKHCLCMESVVKLSLVAGNVVNCFCFNLFTDETIKFVYKTLPQQCWQRIVKVIIIMSTPRSSMNVKRHQYTWKTRTSFLGAMSYGVVNKAY